jgi:hypothetical protein
LPVQSLGSHLTVQEGVQPIQGSGDYPLSQRIGQLAVWVSAALCKEDHFHQQITHAEKTQEKTGQHLMSQPRQVGSLPKISFGHLVMSMLSPYEYARLQHVFLFLSYIAHSWQQQAPVTL